MRKSHARGGVRSSGKANKKDSRRVQEDKQEGSQTGKNYISTGAVADHRAPSQLVIAQTAILDAAETMRKLLPIGAAQKHIGRYLSFEHAGVGAWLQTLERRASLPPLPSWLRCGTVARAMYTVGIEPVQQLQQLHQILVQELSRVSPFGEHTITPESEASRHKRLREDLGLESRGRIAKLVTETRVMYGALLEEAACDLWRKWKLRTEQASSQANTSTQASLQMEGAELLHASVCAAVWTSAHASVLRLANYKSDDDGGYVVENPASRRRTSNVVGGVPSALPSFNLSAEVPLDWEPNLAVPANQFSETNNSGAFSSQIPLGVCNKGSNSMQQLLARSINPASRGWSSSLQTALKNDLSVKSTVNDAFMIGLTGLHAAIEPPLRPKWQQRARIHTLLRPIMQQALMEDTRAVAEVVKDVMRRSLAYDLHHELAARAAMASMQMQAGQLTYPPEAMASGGLMHGMYNVITIATSMVEHLYKFSTNGGNGLPNVSHAAHFAQLCLNTVVSTWVGRVKTPVPRILAIDECASLFMQGFQSRFVPFWIYSVRRGARAQRLDKDQYDSIHGHNVVLQMANSLDQAHTLHIQRRALQHKSVALMTLDEAITFVTPSIDDLLMTDDRAQIQSFREKKRAQTSIAQTKSTDASTLLLGLPSVLLAALLQFASVAWLSEQVKVVELGPRTRILHILVLANVQQLLRHEDRSLVNSLLQNWNDLSNLQVLQAQVDDLERRVRSRPLQIWSVCACMECRRVANAMHQSDPKPVTKRASSNAKPTESRPKTNSSYEVGIVAAMIDLDDCSKLYCAKRPSAALKTALLSVNNATRMAVDRDENSTEVQTQLPNLTHADVDEFDDQEETRPNILQEAATAGLENESTSTVQSSHSRMRRDTKRCYEQRRVAEACGTHAMLSVDCIGRAVQLMDQWYTICTFCGVIMRCTAGAQIGCHLACSMCHSQPQRAKKPSNSSQEHTLLGSILDDLSNESEKNNVQLSIGVRTASRLRERESDKTCRFCNCLCVRRGRGFFAYHSPHDRRGVNDERPPALRITRWCPKHNRAWLKDALKIMPTNIVLAHILMHAKPVNL